MNLNTHKNKRFPIFTYYVQFLLIIILVKSFFKWPSGHLRKKKKNLKPSEILAFLREMVAEASCHTDEQLMSINMIFSVVCSLVAQAEQYKDWADEIGIA